jgi:hypothetical protein
MAIQLSDEMIIMTPEIKDEPAISLKGSFTRYLKHSYYFDPEKGSL